MKPDVEGQYHLTSASCGIAVFMTDRDGILFVSARGYI